MSDKPLKSITFPDLPDRYTIPQIDADLETEGMSADAKVTGAIRNALQSEIIKTSLAEVITPTLTQGSINNNGVNVDSATRVRIGATNVWNGVKVIVPSGLISRVFYYTTTNYTSCVKEYTEEAKSGDRFVYPLTQYFKLWYGYENGDSLSPSDNVGVTFTRYNNTDTTLTNSKIPADAEAVGAALSALESRVAALEGSITTG